LPAIHGLICQAICGLVVFPQGVTDLEVLEPPDQLLRLVVQLAQFGMPHLVDAFHLPDHQFGIADHLERFDLVFGGVAESGKESEFFLDLLFYNYRLRRFVVIDLKIEDFKPEFAGKMNFYLNAVDELERQEGDAATIGLVLCPGRNKTMTQWAVRGLDTPIAVARYTTGDTTMTDETPTALRPALPELPELAAGLAGITEAANVIYDDADSVLGERDGIGHTAVL